MRHKCTTRFLAILLALIMMISLSATAEFNDNEVLSESDTLLSEAIDTPAEISDLSLDESDDISSGEISDPSPSVSESGDEIDPVFDLPTVDESISDGQIILDDDPNEADVEPVDNDVEQDDEDFSKDDTDAGQDDAGVEQDATDPEQDTTDPEQDTTDPEQDMTGSEQSDADSAEDENEEDADSQLLAPAPISRGYDDDDEYYDDESYEIEYYFDDPIFQAFVSLYDDDKDGNLSPDEIADIKTLDLDTEPESYDGLYLLTALESLTIENNDDVDYLSLWGLDNLKKVTIRNVPNIEYLNLESAELTEVHIIGTGVCELDVSATTKLHTLEVVGNDLETLVLGDKPLLRVLKTYGNDDLSTFNINKCPKLLQAMSHGVRFTTGNDSTYGQYKVLNVPENTSTNVEHAEIAVSNTVYTNVFQRIEQELNNPTHPSPGPGAVQICIANFPDVEFRDEVSRFDTDKDGWLSKAEIGNAKKLDWYNDPIESLQGIHYLTELTYIYYCRSNLTEVDVHGLTKLEHLEVWGDLLESVNVDGCENLEYIHVGHNENLCELDVSSCPNLKTLRCGVTGITDLDLTNNPELQVLDCQGPYMKSVDISECPYLLLTVEEGDSNYYGDQEWAFDYVHAWRWDYVEYTYSGYVDGIYVSGRVDVTNPETVLKCDGGASNQEVEIDEQAFPDPVFRQYVLDNFDDGDDVLSPDELATVTSIDCSGAELDAIYNLKGIEYFRKLVELDCSSQQLESLNLSKNKALKVLDCRDNLLTALSLSSNKSLETLHCDGNSISSLNLSSNTKLETVTCTENNMTTLTLGSNRLLAKLFAANNKLTSLDVSDCDLIQYALDEGEFGVYSTGTFMLTAEIDDSIEEVLYIDAPVYWQSFDRNGVAITKKAFPDAKFRSYVSNTFDTNHNGLLSQNEVQAVKVINVSNKKITNLKGIAYFSELVELRCNKNSIKSLDLSGNPCLSRLYCQTNGIKKLNIKPCVVLSKLVYDALHPSVMFEAGEAGNAPLTATVSVSASSASKTKTYSNQYGDRKAELTADKGVKISYNTSVGELGLIDGVPLTEEYFPDANLRHCLTTKKVDRDNNGLLTLSEINATKTLDLSGQYIQSLAGIKYLTSLTELNCSDNLLTAIPAEIWQHKALRKLDCSSNPFEGDGKHLDLSSTLESLDCRDAGITRFNIGQFMILSLKHLDVSGNALYAGSNFDTLVNSSTNLEYLNVTRCELQELDLTFKAKLKTLICENNALTSLTLPRGGALQELNCKINHLEQLNISDCPNLLILNCRGNSLMELDVTHNKQLQQLKCGTNPIESLNLSNNSQLKVLECDKMRLPELFITRNPMLEKLDCYDNGISSLNISNNPRMLEVINGDFEEGSETFIYNKGNLHLMIDADMVLTGDTPVLTLSKKTGRSMYISETMELQLKRGQIKKVKIKSGKKYVKVSKQNKDGIDRYIVEAKSAGKAVLTVTPKKGKAITLTIKVVNQTVPTALKLTKTGTITLYMYKDKDVVVGCNMIPASSWADLVWTIGNNKGGFLSADIESGKVTSRQSIKINPLKPTPKGKPVTIKVTPKRGKAKSVLLKVKVVDPTIPTSVKINPVTEDCLLGQTHTFTAEMKGPLEDIEPESTLTWKVEKDYKSIVSVVNNKTGLFSFNRCGKAVISVKTDRGNVMTKYTFNVVCYPASISLSKKTASYYIGQSFKLSGTVYPTNAIKKQITWSSGTPSVATVDSTGMVKCLSEGTAIIAAQTFNGVRAECTLTVQQPPRNVQYTKKVNEFINDERWKAGTSWGSSKGPEVSTHDAASCIAYACDFCAYVWLTPKQSPDSGGALFTTPSEIRDGDVIKISNNSGIHNYIVLHRSGDTLWTIEGNYGNPGKVFRSTTRYSITHLGDENKTFEKGWHMPGDAVQYLGTPW